MTSVVDALGGLDVESDLEFDTGWESGAEIHVNEGMNHFDGISALAFAVNVRHCQTGTTEEESISRQLSLQSLKDDVTGNAPWGKRYY